MKRQRHGLQAKDYNPREDPLAVAAHERYLKVVDHLPECATCRQHFHFGQIGKNIAFATARKGEPALEALEKLCPTAQAIVKDYNEHMDRWLAAMRKRGATSFTVEL